MAEASDKTRDETSDGASGSDGTSNGRKPNPFAKRTDYAPDAFVSIKVRFRNRERFNKWYAGLFPGVDMLPARDGWADRVFERGLQAVEQMMPAQPSPEERWAKALEESGS